MYGYHLGMESRLQGKNQKRLLQEQTIKKPVMIHVYLSFIPFNSVQGKHKSPVMLEYVALFANSLKYYTAGP